jgi:hypothetical protein
VLSFLGVQIKIPVASFVESEAQTLIVPELHWFWDPERCSSLPSATIF